MDFKKVSLCQDKRFNLSCFGCCGHNFKKIESILDDLKKNTLQFKHSNDLKEFISRGKELTPNGVCKHLIIKGGKILCPLHPLQNNGEEHREEECNILYECKTSYEFKDWSKEKQEKFIKFIKNKNINSIEFSILMDNDFLLNEFKSIK